MKRQAWHYLRRVTSRCIEVWKSGSRTRSAIVVMLVIQLLMFSVGVYKQLCAGVASTLSNLQHSTASMMGFLDTSELPAETIAEVRTSVHTEKFAFLAATAPLHHRVILQM
jgi:hypothetical protein